MKGNMMGCDIHLVLECKFDGDSSWTGVWSSDRMPGSRTLAANRDYGLFSRFAVRGPSGGPVIYPRNIPRDVSELSWKLYMLAPTDHHSASHCTIEEFTSAYLAEHPASDAVREKYASYDLFGVFGEDGEEYRLVFWFDN